MTATSSPTCAPAHQPAYAVLLAALICAVMLGARMLVTPTPRPTDVTALCAPCPTGPPPSLLRCCWTRAALAAAFDGADVTELAVYAIGDGAALSGVLIAARREPGATVVLVFLLD